MGEIMELLIKKGADVNASNISGETPIHRALLLGCELEYIHILLNHRACVDVYSVSQETPLYAAVSLGNKKKISLIIDMGSDINTQNVRGEMSLYKHTKYKRRDTSTLLPI